MGLEENPFIKKAQRDDCTERFTVSQRKNIFYIAMIMDENTPKFNELIGKDFTVNVVKKRLEVLKLGITFSNKAFAYLMIYANGNPGRAVVILIDCLTKYGLRKILSKDLVNLYPNGFYKEEVFADYIDNYLKPQTVAWSEIY